MEPHLNLASLLTEATLALFLIWIIVSYNFLVRKRNRVLAGWSEIDVELKRRHDLVPNLVSTARGYMQHEKEVLENVTQARSQAVTAGNNVAARSAAETTLGLALSQVFARSENYPALRAVESMKLLQEQLASTENRIAYARQFYNDSVREYNTAQASFPRNLISGLLGFSPATLFSAGDYDRAVPDARTSP
jgi:LemA protein